MVVINPTHSQKDSVKASFNWSLTEVLTMHAMLLVDSFKLASRPGTFAIFKFHKMDVLLIGCDPTRV